MKRAGDQYYFEALCGCARQGREAAAYLRDTLAAFDAAALKGRMEGMAAICREAKAIRQRMGVRLGREFIAPMEPEDLMALSLSLYHVVDCIEGVMHSAYIHDLRAMRQDVPPLADLLICCTGALGEAVTALPGFRRPQAIHRAIEEMDALVGEGGALCLKAMRALCAAGRDPMAVIGWLHLYSAFKRCFSACQQAGRTMEGVIIKNT